MITGSHPRHLSIVEEVANTGLLQGLVIEKREPMIVEAPDYLCDSLKKLYTHHFMLRAELEEKYFGKHSYSHIVKNIPVLEIKGNEVNDNSVVNFVEKSAPDVILTYGPGLLKQPLLEICPNKTFNIHGGLSPWYKGSATMFWPFYFLEPNYVGTTIHHITKRIDAGNIVHQVVPTLEYGNSMHEVACKAIVETAKELGKLLALLSERELPGVAQKKNGKLFLDRDWRPEHLRLIYETYEDKIVDRYLNKEIQVRHSPDLIRAW